MGSLLMAMKAIPELAADVFGDDGFVQIISSDFEFVPLVAFRTFERS